MSGRDVCLKTRKNWLPLVSAEPVLAIATVPAGYVAPVRFSLANSYPGPPVPTVADEQDSFCDALAVGSPHCSMKRPSLFDIRWHWVLFQKLSEARWANELTVHVAFEFARSILIGPRLVLIDAVYAAL